MSDDARADLSGFCLPDYGGGSLVNLMRTLGDACGAPALPYAPSHPLRFSLPPQALAARNLMLLVVDGLGYEMLAARASGALRQGLRGALSSVFLSTTACAVPTLMTGLAPARHGLTGWFMYLEELDDILAILPLAPRGSRQPAGGKEETKEAKEKTTSNATEGIPEITPEMAEQLPQRLFDHATFFSTLARPSFAVSPSWLGGSPFNRYHTAGAERVGYDRLDGLFVAVTDILTAGGKDSGEKYVYAYWPELDAVAHHTGCASEETAALLETFCTAFNRFLAGLAGSDTTVIVTADHGFIDSPPEKNIFLSEHSQLEALLARPLCGERRAAWCYLQPGAGAEFERYVARHLGDRAVAIPRARLIEEAWLGPGPMHPRLASRIGDYVLLMRENWTIRDLVEGEEPYEMLGVHGGLSAAEMRVPLVLSHIR